MAVLSFLKNEGLLRLRVLSRCFIFVKLDTSDWDVVKAMQQLFEFPELHMMTCCLLS